MRRLIRGSGSINMPGVHLRCGVILIWSTSGRFWRVSIMESLRRCRRLRQKDASLFAIVSAFDAAYSAYNEFQSKMERYWCLRWLAQNNVRQAEAVVIRDEMIRLVDIPLTIPMPGMQILARGTQVKIDLIRWDEVDLSVEARFVDVSAETAGEIEANEEEMAE